MPFSSLSPTSAGKKASETMLYHIICILFGSFLQAYRSVNAVPMDRGGHGWNWPGYYPQDYQDWSLPHNEVNTWPTQSNGASASQPDLNAFYEPHALNQDYLRSSQSLGIHEPMWHDYAPAASRDLDHVDLEILDSLMEGLSQTEHVAASLGPADGHDTPSALGDQTKRKQGRRAKKQTAPQPNPKETERKRKSVASMREKMKWPEPRGLRELDYIEPMRKSDKAGDIKLMEDGGMQAKINSEVFGGQLEWYGLVHVPNLVGNDFGKLSPISRASRQLPLVRITSPQGIPLRVHITDHNIGLGGPNLGNSPLKDRPYYMFWGIPEAITGTKNNLFLYGVGHLNKDKIAAVDAHLEPLLEASKRAAQARA